MTDYKFLTLNWFLFSTYSVKKYLLPLVLFSSLMGTAVYSQVFRAGGSSGTACPSGAQYKGNGFCRSNDGKQYFPAGGSSGSACPSGSQYKGNGFCKSNNYKQFFSAGGSGTSCPSGTQYKGNGFCRSN